MTEGDGYVLDAIRQWVWAGYYSADDMQGMIDDILEDDSDEDMLRGAVLLELARKIEAEKEWPQQTACDRLDAVFEHLDDQGICAIGNAGYTIDEGFTEVAEAVADAEPGYYSGYCFYHAQDVERAVDGGGLMLAYGAFSADPAAALGVARTVVAALQDAAFEVQWNGAAQSRIHIPTMLWQRRATV